jgi:transposase
MKFKNIIGIDVAKENLELVLLEEGKQSLIAQPANKPKQIESFFKKNKIDLTNTLICLEHTGIYNNHLLEFFSKQGANVWLENPIHIKRSMGMVRGKNDKIDALRIAKFAYQHQEKAKLWLPKREVIESLKSLMCQRTRLIKIKNMLEKPIQEAKMFCRMDLVKSMKEACKSTLKAVKQDLIKIESQIKQTIEEDFQLKELFNYATSVPNVGKIIGAAILVATNEFKSITEPRKFACHCGIAPFEYTSGSSIRGKTRVSHLANKDLKTLLHLAALGSTSRPGEFRDYFKRKVAEGKNKMLVLNAIRNKIIHRVFACVRDKKNYQQSLTFV